jgi:beta-lactamase regulating signal transducer with metallopeptidase domain
VILTTGAVQVLDPAQLDAVLAHERAHLNSHYHRLVAMARIGRQVLPFLPLMRDAEAQVARLAEMHADDAATRVSDPRSLATALVVLATAGNPAPALAAAATDAVQRIHRLLDPAEPLGRGRRQLLRATAAALALTPVLLALAPAARPRARPAPDRLAGQHNPGPPCPVAPAVQHDSWPATPLARAAQPVLFRCDGRQQRRPGSRQ